MPFFTKKGRGARSLGRSFVHIRRLCYLDTSRKQGTARLFGDRVRDRGQGFPVPLRSMRKPLPAHGLP